MPEEPSVTDRRDEWDGPTPVPSGVTERFWAATLDGTLLIQRCADCGAAQFYPRVLCTDCGALEPEWIEADGTGSVYSYTVCHFPSESGFEEFVPYVVAIVDLEEGPQLTAFVTADADDVEIGTPVEVEFWRISDDAAMPVFTPR